PWLPFVLLTVLSAISIMLQGATPGHALFRLRVATTSETEASFLKQMLRFLFMHGWWFAFVLLFQRLVRGLATPDGFDLLALAWFAAVAVSGARVFTKSRQTLFDRVVGLKVVS